MSTSENFQNSNSLQQLSFVNHSFGLFCLEEHCNFMSRFKFKFCYISDFITHLKRLPDVSSNFFNFTRIYKWISYTVKVYNR